MSLKHVTAAVLAAVALTAAAPAVAHASWQGELAAAGWAERWAMQDYRGYDFTANCQDQGGNRYWCQLIGRRGNCYRSGHASIRNTRTAWRGTIYGLQRECF